MRQIVNDAMTKPDGGNSSEGRFSLNTRLLQSVAVDRMSDDFVPENRILLDAASIEEQSEGGIVIVHGRGVQLPFTGMQVSLYFSAQSNEVEFKLVATGGKTWNLSTAFPLFGGTFVQDIIFAQAPLPRLFLYSHKMNDGKGPGLFFEGMANLAAMTGGVTEILGFSEAAISGVVELKELGSKLYKIDVAGPVTESKDLGFFTVKKLAFKIGNRLIYNSRRKNYSAIPYIEIGGEFPFATKRGERRIPIFTQITNFDSDIRFSVNLTDGIDAALNEIEAITNNIGFESLLPPDFQLEKILKLDDFFFDFNLKRENKISCIGVGIQSTTPWKILPGNRPGKEDVAVRNVALSFRAYPPFGVQDTSLSFRGELSLGKAGTLMVGARYPDWLIQCHLKEGTSLSLVEVLDIFLDSKTAVPEIDVDVLDLEVSADSYSVAAELNGYWPIPVGNTELAIEQLGFSINHAKELGTQAVLTGIFDVAGVTVQLTANHPAAPDAGWEFSGSTGPGQIIPIGTLIADLAELFGNDIKEKLPPAIADLTIEDLGLSFNAKTRDFSFTCKAQFPVDSNAKVAITVTITITPIEKKFGGLIEIKVATLKDPLKFKLEFLGEKAGGETSALFVAAYAGGKQNLNIGDLIRAVAQDQPDWTHALDSISIEMKDALFAFSKTGEEKKFLFGLDIGADINLAQLPLVGKEFPPDRTVGINDLQILVASKPFSAAEVKKLNGLIPAGVTKLPDISQNAGDRNGSLGDATTIALKQGLNVGATLKLGDTTRNLSLPVVAGGSPQTTGSPAATSTTQAVTTTDNASWFKIQKSLGPVHFERVGVQYKDAAVWFLLDASLAAVGLTLSLDGLSIGSPINKFEPRFDLRGLGIDYRNDAFEIGGAFLKIADKEYAGAAVIKAKQLTLSALGMYKEMADGHPSVFVYAVLDYPIGGPAFFFVTGLAAGFGYSRALKIPTIDKVASFSLVENARKGAGMPENIGAELQKLANDITPAAGENFLAIGVKFTSFKIVESFALLTVSFGSHFEINLLGLSTLVAPANAGANIPPVAEAQLALKATFQPDKGFLGVQAQLTPNSYLLSKDCHLTGGFAFYSWFAGSEHDGDFVLTLGGYHPHFRVPEHYPTVPRLGFNWQVSPELSLKGDAYFALTASALMAGGHLEANWRSGSVHAWFKLGVDFLIAWKPYHYEIAAYVEMGVEVTFEFFGTQHISVHVGADLSIWGPEFSGEATIHLWIISFTVKFGAAASHKPQPIEWPEFKTSFLPADKDVCAITVTGGMIGKDSQDAVDLGVINPKHFSLATNSVVPFTTAQYALKDKKQTISLSRSPGRFGIASMAVAATDLTSTQTITIKREGAVVSGEFDYTPIFKKVPTGLWGESLTPEVNGKQFVENALSGFEIRPKTSSKLQPGSETAAIERGKLQADGFSLAGEFRWESVKTFTAATFDSEQKRRDELRKTLATGAAGRNAILAALGFTPDDLGKIALSAAQADDFLIAPQIEQS